jgi:hypothetical protein
LGKAGADAGVDFLVVNSHTPRKKTWKSGKLFQANGYYGKTLVMVGEEIDDRWRKDSHGLVMGLDRWIGRRKPFPETFAEVRQEKGLTFLAHPDGRHRLYGIKSDHAWKRWEISSVDGMEVWSLLFDWAGSTHIFNLPARYLGFPGNLQGPSPYNLALWDRLAQRQKTTGVAGLDIHPLLLPCLDVKKNFNYATVFKVLRNHLLLTRPLTGKSEEDRSLILDCLRKGNLFFANDLLADSRGFFFGNQASGLVMGDTVPVNTEAEVQVPGPARLKLVHNGVPLWEENQQTRKIVFKAKGVYRIEVYREDKPWIFSNPIYVKQRV